MSIRVLGRWHKIGFVAQDLAFDFRLLIYCATCVWVVRVSRGTSPFGKILQDTLVINKRMKWARSRTMTQY